MYALGLEPFGIAVAQAATAAEGFAAAIQLRPKVIVTDLTLPDMDGLELCERLQLEAITRDIPIIALTGRSAGDAQLPGCIRRLLLKPCLPDDLAVAVREFLRG
jgi:CheY-like chemotaxis protein